VISLLHGLAREYFVSNTTLRDTDHIQ